MQWLPLPGYDEPPNTKANLVLNPHRYAVPPDMTVRLAEWDPDDAAACAGGKDEARPRFREARKALSRLQRMLYAQGKHRVLVVLQGMDTSGKNAVIRKVFSRVSPLGLRAVSFREPEGEERRHNFLWRVSRQLPRTGELVIFNRSHYEAVVAERVLNLTPKRVWSRRHEHINAFERMLVDEGTTVLKFFLHIDAEEQKRRFRSRLNAAHKQWKLSEADFEHRRLWPQFQEAYEDVLSRTSTPQAPWLVVPSNRKWYRNLVVCERIVDALESLGVAFPPLRVDLDTYRID